MKTKDKKAPQNWIVGAVCAAVVASAGLFPVSNAWAQFATTPVAPLMPGTDTGHGGNGGSMLSGVSHYDPVDAATWCGAVAGYISDALRISRYASRGPGEVRAFLVQSVHSILAAYQGGGIPYQPLTYSLLATTEKINRNFPANEQGDQSAAITLFHLMETARSVNTRFDVPRFVPFINLYQRCGRHHHGGPHDTCGAYDEMEPPFYVDYISSATEVLRMFFSPSIPSKPQMGTVLDAMSHDVWELNVLLDLLKWLEVDLDRDIFSRRLVCVRAEVKQTRVRLENYLKGLTPPFNDTTMRWFTEEALQGILQTLESVTVDRSSCSCGYRRY